MDKSIAEAMFASAAGVLSTLVDRTVSAGPVAAGETEASIRIVPDVVATLTTIPAAHFCFVTRYEKDDLTRVVELMLGTPAEGGELDAMQLSIVSETVAQISSAMAERLTQDLHVPADGIHTDLVTDAGAFPAPPFDSFVASLEIGTDFSARMTIDFDGVARTKIEPKPAASTRRVAPPPESQPVTYTAMTPTPIRAAAPGQANLDLVHDIPLEISAVLGQTALSLRDVVALQTGSVFELDKLATDPIDLYVNNILIARGEVVVVDDKFAVKISELNPAVDKV